MGRVSWLSITLIGVAFQIYFVDGLRCNVCIPLQERVDFTTKPEADNIRNRIRQTYGNEVKECSDDFKTRILMYFDSSYTRDCSGTDQWCYKYQNGPWSARTCRNGPNNNAGCSGFGDKFDCYCNDRDNCNSSPGIQATVMNIAYGVVSAFVLNKFI